jgi:hypothetical protein
MKVEAADFFDTFWTIYLTTRCHISEVQSVYKLAYELRNIMWSNSFDIWYAWNCFIHCVSFETSFCPVGTMQQHCSSPAQNLWMQFFENTREPGCLRPLRKLLRVAYLYKVKLNLSVCHEDVVTGWRWVVSLLLRPLCPNGKSSLYELVTRWTPEPVWMWRWRDNIPALDGNWTLIVQSVANHFTDMVIMTALGRLSVCCS